MKRFSLTAFVFCVTCPLLLAGTESVVRTSNSKSVVATPEPEACNWTGFYLGGTIGAAFTGDTDIHLDLTGDWESFPEPSDETFAQDRGNHDLDASGLLAGGFLGYNYQFGNWVIGGEADFAYLGLRDSFNSGLDAATGSGNLVNVRQSLKTHYLITLGPRIGYTWDRVLLYATGGVAFADVQFKQSIKEPEFGFREAGDTDDTQVGWTVGGGLEYCINRHWSARLEYRYTDLECADFGSQGNAGFTDFTGNHKACVNFHAVTAGLAFRF